jgi:4-hydroxythreonine-4-phosphate dehydrogenase
LTFSIVSLLIFFYKLQPKIKVLFQYGTEICYRPTECHSAMTIKKQRPVLGISIGDINGIGTEVLLKTLADARSYTNYTPLIYGHGKALSFYKKLLNLEELYYTQIRSIDELQHRKINVINCLEECPEVTPGVATAASGNLALQSFAAAVADLKAGKIQGLVTAPLNKSNIHTEAIPFVGHTEYLSQAVGANEGLMMLVSEDLRVALVTGHIPLAKVPTAITKEKIIAKAKVFLKSLEKDFGIHKPKIAILGLNPHAGEEGVLGTEEETILKPAIQELKDAKHYVFGPYPADGFFGMMHQQKFDGVLALYHDQGLIPFKSLAFSTGVNFTAGLPVVRTSPDHGTAYDIAGKNMADCGSMRAALFLAADIVNRHEKESEEVR